MLRQNIDISLRTWGFLGFLLITLLADSNASAADDPPSNSTKATGEAQFAPVRVGSKTGEAWNGNSIQMDFLWCPTGQFVMGSPPDEPERSDDENQVEVTLTQGFWLGKYEVTQAQWKTVMNTEPWKDQADVREGPDYPACWLNWEDASLFCQEMTRRERESGALPDGWAYVLPTEAQWEYACRAGTTTKFSFGDDDSELSDYAWYGERERDGKELYARTVGQKLPNPWGFHDMHANIVEWCRDWYQPEYPGGVDPYVATEFNNRITCRGGEWRIELKWARSACRQMLRPVRKGATIGFRVSLQQVDPETQPAVASMKLAVVPFENRGTSIAYGRIGQELAGLVASDLAELAALDVLERQTTEDLLQESTLAKGGVMHANPANEKRDFADYVLTGSFTVSGERLTVVAALTKPGSDKPQAVWTLHDSINDLFDLEARLAANIIKTLDVNNDRQAASPPRRGESPTVAILPLANNSATARLDDMQTGFAELLQGTLGELEGVRLVDREQIEKILAEQQLSLSGLVDPATAIQVGKLLGAQRLVTGSFLELGKQLSIQVRIVDTRTAAVVGAAKATGPTETFGELLDTLTRGVATKLEVPMSDKPDDSSGRPRAGRSLEAALHIATGNRFRREGNLPQAADAYQQAILIEPNNSAHHLLRMYVLADSKSWDELIKTAEHALSFPNEIERLPQLHREYLIHTLGFAYLTTGRLAALEELRKNHSGLSRSLGMILTVLFADGLVNQRRFEDAEAAMVEMAEKDVAEFGLLRSEGLQKLFQFHVHHSTSVVGIPIKVHQEQAQKAIDIYERVLEAAKDSRDEGVAEWAALLIPSALEMETISDDNQRVLFVSASDRAMCQQQELEVFSWLPEFGFGRLYEMAVANEEAQEWEQAVANYQRFLEHTPDVCEDSVQPVFLNNGNYLGGWIDKRIEAQYRLAHIQSTQLDKPNEGRQSFQTLVREHGLSNQTGPDAIVEMHKLGITPEIPAASALVWGGKTSNLYGWRHLLATERLTMHAVRKDGVTLADLAPYRLVILNKSGDYPYMPSELLALRSYVASGGSLLVIVSPQWHAAAPILHNSLLTLFDMQAEAEVIDKAESTRIVPHPITQGIDSFIAYQAVALSVPKDSALILASDKTILAARDYHHGRIVVAAVGQWFTPEILLIPENESLKRTTVAYGSTFQEDLTRIRGTAPESPLLRQTLRWLGESRDQDQEFEEWRRQWRAALFAFAEAQACIGPRNVRVRDWDDLPDVFDRLVADAPTAELKQESLWTAGEALIQPGFLFKSPPVFVYRGGKPPRDMEERMQEYESQEVTERPHLSGRSTARRFDPPVRPGLNAERKLASEAWQPVVLTPAPKYFERLIDDHADSPLLPYAKLRLADALRLQDPTTPHFFGPENSQPVRAMMVPYEKANLKPGTYPDAWSQLHLGLLHYAIDEYEQAGTIYDEVAESMPASAEKGMALLNAAKCYIVRGEFNEARRRLGQVDLLPNIDCRCSFGDFVPDSQATFSFFRYRSADYHFLRQELEKEIEQLPNDEGFQKRQESIRRSRTEKPR